MEEYFCVESKIKGNKIINDVTKSEHVDIGTAFAIANLAYKDIGFAAALDEAFAFMSKKNENNS